MSDEDRVTEPRPPDQPHPENGRPRQHHGERLLDGLREALLDAAGDVLVARRRAIATLAVAFVLVLIASLSGRALAGVTILDFVATVASSVAPALSIIGGAQLGKLVANRDLLYRLWAMDPRLPTLARDVPTTARARGLLAGDTKIYGKRERALLTLCDNGSTPSQRQRARKTLLRMDPELLQVFKLPYEQVPDHKLLAWNRHGMWWSDLPTPALDHDCYAWTVFLMTATVVRCCPCGATAASRDEWLLRNSRRKGWPFPEHNRVRPSTVDD